MGDDEDATMAAAEVFHRDGFTVLKGLFDQGSVDVVRKRGESSFDELQALIAARGLSLGIGIKEGFREVVQRHPHRFEMPYQMDSPEIASLVTGNVRLMDTVHAILGNDCDCINKSLVMSMPGAADQGWHVDGGHVSLSEHLPCHCLNVFIPLVDVLPEDGPTELRAASHRLTRDLKKMYLAAFLSKRLGAVSAPCLPRGDALLFDYRTLHRGRANTSSRRRPILVYTFAKRGFRDLLNFPSYSVLTAVPRTVPSASFLYRVTGPQSISRLAPLLRSAVAPRDAVEATDPADPSRLDFCWETACEQAWRARHSGAAVLNRLHNSAILEDKGSLAFLQLRMSCPCLQTYVAAGPAEVLAWARHRWGLPQSGRGEAPGEVNDWWVVKAARGNGGRDVWVMSALNYLGVEREFAAGEQLVVQRYVNRPLLLSGRKFHFRCYSLMMADGAALVYQKAFLLTAGLDYLQASHDNPQADPTTHADNPDAHAAKRHITNLSTNKHTPQHPGQIPAHLPSQFPEQYARICGLWASVVQAAGAYMQHQQEGRFEFLGLDVICDQDGGCWLIEINRLPGLESSANNRVQEDAMYDEMMAALLAVVLGRGDAGGGAGMWDVVREGAEGVAGGNGAKAAEPCFNLLKWKAFTRGHRTQVLLPAPPTPPAAPAASTSASTPTPTPTPNPEASAAAAATARPSCGLPGCLVLAPPLRCSRCKLQHYCCEEHQRAHFPTHKTTCRPPPAPSSASASATSSSGSSSPSSASSSPSSASPDEPPRISRCMFCGEEITLRSEAEAVEHMRVCPALQEQLASKDQFTIPQVLRDKGVRLPGQPPP